MFGGREDEGMNNANMDQGPQAEDTIIGNTIRIEGDLVSNGNIIVDGEVVGTLKTERTLRVGGAAKVKADIKAAEALISGEVTGNVDIDGRLELTASARVTGDIKAKVLSIESGATFNGSCTMDESVMMADHSASAPIEVSEDEVVESKEKEDQA
ncbi:hypothetical protein COT97_00110 [Candidatus Falkowbacteria bacterium CG10_big_fil_rev_8_21_14_0_10_39_11]|uniref:Cell shape determination protein CcmA n=1 Tax=Candidatus Falkowbacteria bacterium CG10_big_fil_rev_8_21_14_0_10_39_11 TaxID=1974565 RepID=A0A2H0V8I3_9BACT|nr:MAG: hypothetical protein COT97_00110 [Candidatus Falkowbacteria bacterium CG10_big_fil_rev_8_21_14_0_10_39_11]